MRRDDYLSCLFILFPHIGNVFSTHTSFQSHFLNFDLFFHDYHLQQSNAQSIIFGICLYKKEYEPKVIIIRSKLSLTVLQVKKFEHLLSKSSFSAVSPSRKNFSPDDPRSICQKSYTCINPYIGKANFFMIPRDWKLHFLQIALVFFKIKAVFFFFQYENKTQKVSFFLHLLCY